MIKEMFVFVVIACIAGMAFGMSPQGAAMLGIKTGGWYLAICVLGIGGFVAVGWLVAGAESFNHRRNMRAIRKWSDIE